MSNKVPLFNGLEARIAIVHEAIKAHSNLEEIKQDMDFFDEQCKEMLVIVKTLRDLENIEGKGKR